MDPRLLEALTANTPLDEGYALDLSEPQGYGQLTPETTEAALAQLGRQERGPMGPAEAHRYNEGLQPLTGGTNWDTEAQDAFATTPPGRAIETGVNRLMRPIFNPGAVPEGHVGGSPAIFNWIGGRAKGLLNIPRNFARGQKLKALNTQRSAAQTVLNRAEDPGGWWRMRQALHNPTPAVPMRAPAQTGPLVQRGLGQAVPASPSTTPVYVNGGPLATFNTKAAAKTLTPAAPAAVAAPPIIPKAKTPFFRKLGRGVKDAAVKQAIEHPYRTGLGVGGALAGYGKYMHNLGNQNQKANDLKDQLKAENAEKYPAQ